MTAPNISNERRAHPRDFRRCKLSAVIRSLPSMSASRMLTERMFTAALHLAIAFSLSSVLPKFLPPSTRQSLPFICICLQRLAIASSRSTASLLCRNAVAARLTSVRYEPVVLLAALATVVATSQKLIFFSDRRRHARHRCELTWYNPTRGGATKHPTPQARSMHQIAPRPWRRAPSLMGATTASTSNGNKLCESPFVFFE